MIPISTKTAQESKEENQFNEKKKENLETSSSSEHTLRRYPFRVTAEPFENLLNHQYENKGTEEEPIYLVDFLADDLENPMQLG